MISATDSERRRNNILEAIVEAYVSTAAPVGSELVARRLRMSLSSATIRHVMGQLEEEGLLEQPHTSAGRVPTDLGYRRYVTSIMSRRSLTQDQARQLQQRLASEDVEVEPFLAHAADLLAEWAAQAAFVVAPTVKRSTVKQVELVPLGVQRLLCVLVTHEELIASHVIEISEPLTRDETAALARFINTELVGLPFGELLGSLERRMLAETDSFYHLVKRSFEILQHALSTEPPARLFLEGTSYVIAQPEFHRDAAMTQALLRRMESPAALLESLRQAIAPEGVQVRIGEEVQLGDLRMCSTLTAPLAARGEVVGGIGVLGPKRMDYPRMWSLVDGMAACVSEALSMWEVE